MYAFGNAFGVNTPAPRVSVDSSPLEEFVFTEDVLRARISTNGTFPVTLSNGSTISVTATVPDVISFQSWDLTAESWGELQVLWKHNSDTHTYSMLLVPVSNDGPVTGYTTKSVNLTLSTLTSWLTIPELATSSGTGGETPDHYAQQNCPS